MKPVDILNFWFVEIESKQWWQKDDAFDQTITERFLAVHSAAAACELFSWRESASGRLAEILILDQFSRNIFRDTARAFDLDSLALVLAQEAVFVKADKDLPPEQRSFLYMPFMHSESALIHEQAVTLFSQTGLEFNLDFELKHKTIIDRFARYPHRNTLLGRESTSEEVEFLKQPGSSF